MLHRKLNKFIALLPLTWITFEYVISNGIKPGLALTLPVIFWVSLGINYTELIGLKGSKAKIITVAWLWPIHYKTSSGAYVENKIRFTVNGIDYGDIRVGDFFESLKGVLGEFKLYIEQIANITRAATFGILTAIIVTPIVILSICLLTAYFNKLYLWDLMARWKDPLEPMKEMKDALLAGKLLAISVAYYFLNNVFQKNALDKIRIERRIANTGFIKLEPK